MLNPDLDRKKLAREFSADQRVRIDNIFQQDVAERIHAVCKQHVPYDYTCVIDDEFRIISPAEMQQLSAQEREQLVKALYTAASKGIGFMYARFPISNAENHSNEEVRFLHEFYKYINSPEMLDFVQEVSGRTDILSADSQATCYTPGHYLTRHRDVQPGEERRLAYVFGFSESWHPDWGGLLQFYEQSGNPRDAWSPAFNSLALFDVKHIHAVTYVAPFAAAQRLSLTGWFRAISSKLAQEQLTTPA